MGRKYAVFDKNGLPRAFYDDDIHSDIPNDAIEITEEQWKEFINNQGFRKWDFKSKQVVSFDPDDLLTIDELKERLKRQIHIIRKEKENKGIVVIGSGGKNKYLFDTSLTGRSNTQGVISAFDMGFLDPQNDKVHWKFMDGVFMDIDYNQLKELAGFALKYVEALFIAEGNHYRNIDSLSSIDDAKKYDVNANWPSNEYKSSLLP